MVIIDQHNIGRVLSYKNPEVEKYNVSCEAELHDE